MTSPRDTVAAAGRRRLLSHGIDGLRSQLNASVLARESPVSRDTAYRVFRDDEIGEGVTDAIITAVAQATTDMGQDGYDVALAAAVEAYQDSLSSGNDTPTNLMAALRATFEAQFRSPSALAGWVLQAGAFTASKAWLGDPPAAPDGVEVAEAILETRRAYYERVTDQLVALARITMSELGRRPRAGVDLRSVVKVTHFILDGAVLRRLIDPDAVPAEIVADAMFQLWLAFSQPGPYVDPRRPDDERNLALFERLLDGAADLWSGKAEITVDDAAGQAGISEDAATLLFPAIGDLADSLLRARVVGGGFAEPGLETGEIEARQHVLIMVTELQRLRDLADAVPHAVAAARAHRPTRSTSFLDDLVDIDSRVVETFDLTPHPRQLAEDLVRFAADGTPAWPAVTALLRTIGYRPEPVS
jgi:hypothetical protein